MCILLVCGSCFEGKQLVERMTGWQWWEVQVRQWHQERPLWESDRGLRMNRHWSGTAQGKSVPGWGNMWDGLRWEGEKRPAVASFPSHSGQRPRRALIHSTLPCVIPHDLSNLVLWCPFLSLTSPLTSFLFTPSERATFVPSHSSNTPGKFLPQGLCTCHSLAEGSTARELQGSRLTFFWFFTHKPLCNTCCGHLN